jgi:hypothetical protein
MFRPYDDYQAIFRKYRKESKIIPNVRSPFQISLCNVQLFKRNVVLCVCEGA